jgi:hypothetical protein
MQTRSLDDYLVPSQQCVSCGYGIRILSTGLRYQLVRRSTS